MFVGMGNTQVFPSHAAAFAALMPEEEFSMQGIIDRGRKPSDYQVTEQPVQSSPAQPNPSQLGPAGRHHRVEEATTAGRGSSPIALPWACFLLFFVVA